MKIKEEWKDRCGSDGHKRYVDKNGIRRYIDNDIEVSALYRPCAKCNEFPTDDGDDDCIKNLGRVANACCGHGLEKGYIQFDNGITIRGFFEIEKSNIINMDYKIRSRKEIFEKIKTLENENIDGRYDGVIEGIKWAMGVK